MWVEPMKDGIRLRLRVAPRARASGFGGLVVPCSGLRRRWWRSLRNCRKWGRVPFRLSATAEGRRTPWITASPISRPTIPLRRLRSPLRPKNAGSSPSGFPSIRIFPGRAGPPGRAAPTCRSSITTSWTRSWRWRARRPPPPASGSAPASASSCSATRSTRPRKSPPSTACPAGVSCSGSAAAGMPRRWQITAPTSRRASR